MTRESTSDADPEPVSAPGGGEAPAPGFPGPPGDREEAENGPGDGPARTDFRCPECGATTTWDPAADALACLYCGTRVDVPRAGGEVRERALEEAGDAARGLGLETRSVRCAECGASVALDEAATAGACVFCGSSSVLPQASNRHLLRPESLIPLDVCHDAAERGFRRWLKGLWFRPSALKRLQRFDALGVYVPYWTFDARVHSDWSADAGHHYYVTRTVPVRVGGQIRMQRQRVRRVRWVPAWGARDDTYDDLLVNASRGVPDELVVKLGGFDSRGLVPYRPEYLAGWRAEEYQLDLEGGWERARETILRTQRARCASDVPGDTHRRLSVDTDIDGVRWKHVLLPIWSLSYELGGKRYSVLVHGQTGHVVGRAPYSWVKLLLLALVVLAVVAAVVLSS